MAKAKQHAGGMKKVKNPHLHARIAFLQQAAQLLQQKQTPSMKDGRCEPSYKEADMSSDQEQAHGDGGEAKCSLYEGMAASRGLTYHSTVISKKSKVRLAQEAKRTTCKRCSAKLVDGQTSVRSIENNSRRGKLPWANVLTVTCTCCGAMKRYPIGQKRGIRKSKRQKAV